MLSTEIENTNVLWYTTFRKIETRERPK